MHTVTQATTFIASCFNALRDGTEYKTGLTKLEAVAIYSLRGLALIASTKFVASKLNKSDSSTATYDIYFNRGACTFLFTYCSFALYKQAKREADENELIRLINLDNPAHELAIKRLIRKMPDVNKALFFDTASNAPITVLQKVCAQGNLHLVKYIFDTHTDQVDLFANTRRHIVGCIIYSRNISLVNYFLDERPNLLMMDINGWNVWKYTLEYYKVGHLKDSSILKKLVDVLSNSGSYELKCFIVDNQKLSLLHTALDLDLPLNYIKKIVAACPDLLTYANAEGQLPFLRAAGNSREDRATTNQKASQAFLENATKTKYHDCYNKEQEKLAASSSNFQITLTSMSGTTVSFPVSSSDQKQDN